MNAWSIISLVIGLAYATFVLLFLDKVQKVGCACALTWERKFIRIYMTVCILLLIFTVGLNAAAPGALMSPSWSILMFLWQLVTLANLIISLNYIRDLQKGQCKCSDTTSRQVWEIILWIQVAALIVAFVGAVVLVGLGTAAATRPRRSSSK